MYATSNPDSAWLGQLRHGPPNHKTVSLLATGKPRCSSLQQHASWPTNPIDSDGDGTALLSVNPGAIAVTLADTFNDCLLEAAIDYAQNHTTRILRDEHRYSLDFFNTHIEQVIQI
jgi:hypothetical protein